MPLTKVGTKVLKRMIDKYGKKEGTRVFYSSINKGVAGSDKWHRKMQEDKRTSKYTKALAA